MDAAAWDERYRGRELVWSAGPNRFVADRVAGLDPAGRRALDLACGEGRNAIWLAAQGWRVTAVDFSEVAIAKAAELASARRVDLDLRVGDVTRWEPEPGAYGLVVLAYLHLPGAAMADVIARAAAAVGDGGVLVAVGHALANLTGGHGGPQDPDVLWTADAIARSVAATAPASWRIDESGDVDREVETPDGRATAIDTVVVGRRAECAKTR